MDDVNWALLNKSSRHRDNCATMLCLKGAVATDPQVSRTEEVISRKVKSEYAKLPDY